MSDHQNHQRPGKKTSDKPPKGNVATKSRKKPQSESEKEAQKVRMSEILPDLDDEPRVAGASCIHRGQEIEKWKEDYQRLAEQVKKLEGDNTQLEGDNKKLRDAVERSDVQTGKLKCQVDELTAKLQDSARSEIQDRVDGATMTEEDTDNDYDLFQSFTTEETESTDGPHAPHGDLQSFGRMAEERHTHGHMKQSELAAMAVKQKEALLREGEAHFATTPLQHQKEAPAINETDMRKQRKVEERAQQLETELNDAKKEKEDLEDQIAEVRYECERAKQKTVADAEKDKNHLIEHNEHLQRTNESLNDLLKERDDTLRQQQEDLRRMKALFEAISDTPVKQASAVAYERCHSFPLRAGEPVRKADSPSSSRCTLANDKESEQLKAMQEALKQGKADIQRKEQELTESALQHQAEVDRLKAEQNSVVMELQKGQEMRTVMKERVDKHHQGDVVELKAKVKAAEDIAQQLENEHEKQEEMARRLKEQQGELDNLKAKLHSADERARQLENDRKVKEEMARKLKQQQDEMDDLKGKVQSAEEREKRFKTSNQLLVMTKEEEVTRAKEKLRDASQVVGTLQAKVDGLSSQITSLQAALAEAREENAARTEHETKLMTQFQTDVADRDDTIKQLKEKGEQLEAQATTYKLDFEQERNDRAEAMGRFEGEREKFLKDIMALTKKQGALQFQHDETVAHLEQLKETSVDHKRELKEKDEQLRHVIGSCTGLEQKLTSLQSALDKVMKENANMKARLQNQERDVKAYKAIEAAYQKSFKDAETYKGLYHEAESKRSAAASRVQELAMVVNAIEEKGNASAGDNVEALREEVQRMKGHNDALEAAYQRVASEKQQLAYSYQELQSLNGKLQTENHVLKGRWAAAGGHEVSHAARSSQGGGAFRSFQGSIGATGPSDKHNAMQPVIAGQPRAKQRMDGNGEKGDFVGGAFAGDFVEKDSPPGSNVGNRGPLSAELISLPPAALPQMKQPESRFNSAAGRGGRPGTDPRMAAIHPPPRGAQQPVVGLSHAMAESHGQPPRGQLPNTTPNMANAYAPEWTLGKHPTDPYLNRQESSASASTEGSLPMPFTRPPGPVAASPDDSLLTSFEADQRYIGEGINTEIRREARRYKKVEVGAVAAPVQADDQEWPLDPNLTCPYCKVVFRRGQMREYRYHVDECQP